MESVVASDRESETVLSSTNDFPCTPVIDEMPPQLSLSACFYLAMVFTGKLLSSVRILPRWHSLAQPLQHPLRSLRYHRSRAE